MVGRELGEQFPRRAPHLGGERLRLENFSVFPHGFSKTARRSTASRSRCAPAKFSASAGLQGSGASELFSRPVRRLRLGHTAARCSWTEKKFDFTSPRQAIDSGVALLTNDRKASGLVLSLSIIANATLAGLPALSPGGWRRPARERAAAEKITSLLRLRAASLDLEAGTLSGGNQQKVAVAKWLQIRPRLTAA